MNETKQTKYNIIQDILEGPCPHCHAIVQIEKQNINCGIFRHAFDINTGQQINPHASKEECSMLMLKSIDLYKFKLAFLIRQFFNTDTIVSLIIDYGSLKDVTSYYNITGCLGPFKINQANMSFDICPYI